MPFPCLLLHAQMEICLGSGKVQDISLPISFVADCKDIFLFLNINLDAYFPLSCISNLAIEVASGFSLAPSAMLIAVLLSQELMKQQ